MLNLATQTPDQCSTPTYIHTTLYQNIFQGEPAISGFDWHITPYHSSSENLVTFTCAALHSVLPLLQPDHGKLTRFRVIHMQLKSPYSGSLSLRLRPGMVLTLLHTYTRRLILQ